jgi:NAD(P)-dependent dehydrogenase (short-subunit alcohol dehydrogenase family)
MTDQVALVTGGASGFGAAVARRLHQRGWSVVVADVDGRGEAVADEVGGVFVETDVRDPAASTAAVGVAVETYGGLDLAFLNAGVSSQMGVGDDFDVDRYRHVMGVNLDGVVFGAVAALPALEARGGQIVATSSLAGLVPVAMDPLYAANKHAVVGLVRSLGQAYAGRGVRVNALCPGFADTPLIAGGKELLREAGFPIIPVEDVVAAFERIVDSDGTGECWFVQAGRPSEPFAFRRVPGPRVAPDGQPIPGGAVAEAEAAAADAAPVEG